MPCVLKLGGHVMSAPFWFTRIFWHPFFASIFYLIKKALVYKDRVNSIDVLEIYREFVNNDYRVTTFLGLPVKSG